MPFAALAKQAGVSPSYFTRLVRLSYLAPDIAQAVLDGRQPAGADCRQATGTLTSTGSLARAAEPCSALPEPIRTQSSTEIANLLGQLGDLTADKLLAHSRLPLAWHDQRTALGFAHRYW